MQSGGIYPVERVVLIAMIYTISLYTSLTIFAIGCLYKFLQWFRLKVGPEFQEITAWERLGAAVKGISTSVFGKRLPILMKIFFVDVLLQGWLLKTRFSRWFSHMCIYGGFIFLLVMHGLENIVTTAFFPDYASTLNPFMFLRDLAAGIVLLGIFLILFRRVVSKAPRPKTTAADWFAIVALAFIMVTGILLEAVKITSYSSFQEMVEEYGGLDSQEETSELKALEAYWVESFGVVSPNTDSPFNAQLLAEGEELHAISCADCHSRPYWAFIGYGVAGATRPAALVLDRAEVKTFLWYVHFLACFIGLALVPFSKFFHIIATPLYLLVNTAMKDESQPAIAATKRAMELDACTHCGECTTRCSVAITVKKIPNPNILPSEKLVALRKLASGKKISRKKIYMIQEGNHICTDCHRCTDVCPVGINLEAQWHSLGLELVERGFQRLEIWARDNIRKAFDIKAMEGQKIALAVSEENMPADGLHTTEAQTFSACYGCQTCTNVCPVVANYEAPREQVDLLPHQIMHALALDRRDMALGARMLWDCVTCYLCQEECPQGVCVTEVLYDLKNLAVSHLKEEDTSR